MLAAAACSAGNGDESNGDGDGDGDGDVPGVGGTYVGDGDGDVPGAGGLGGDGDGDGTGGVQGDGDGDGTGGNASVSVCPPGSESMVLDLTGKTPSSAVSGVPPAGYNQSFNLEGPVWINGALYASEISTSAQPNPARIIRYVPGQAPTVFLDNAGTNGLAVNSDGDLVVARQSDGSVSVIDIDSPMSTAMVLTGMYDGARYNSPNDLTISSTGHIYFTDPDWQAPSTKPQAAERAYHLPPGGTATPITGTPQKPNGITLSLNQQTLYITGTDGLMSYPVMSGGSIGSGTAMPQFFGGGDGMGMDCAGNLFATNGEKIVVYNAAGSHVGEIPVGASVTNIAFGGAEGKTMFITSLQPAALRTLEMDIPGLPY